MQDTINLHKTKCQSDTHRSYIMRKKKGLEDKITIKDLTIRQEELAKVILAKLNDLQNNVGLNSTVQ